MSAPRVCWLGSLLASWAGSSLEFVNRLSQLPQFLALLREFLLPVVEIRLVGIERRDRFGQLRIELQLLLLPFTKRALMISRSTPIAVSTYAKCPNGRRARRPERAQRKRKSQTVGLERDRPQDKVLFWEQAAGNVTRESVPAN